MHKNKQKYIIKSNPNMDNFVHLLFTGPIDQHILRITARFLFKILGSKSLVKRKIFIILVELLSNVSNHSAEKKKLLEKKEVGIGTIVISESKNAIFLSTINRIENSNIEKLRDKCNKINTLNKEQLRAYKRQELVKPYEKYDGAHIGLIQIALSSGENLLFKFENLNDNFSYFSIEIRLKKSIKKNVHVHSIA